MENKNQPKQASGLSSRSLNCSTRRDDGEEICCPFCSSIVAVIFDNSEIICGNPSCEAYPKIVSRQRTD